MPALFPPSNSSTSPTDTLASKHPRKMVSLRKAESPLPSSSSTSSSSSFAPSSSPLSSSPPAPSPKATALAEANCARTKVAVLLAKYHATRSSRIPVPVSSSPHQSHVSNERSAVLDLAAQKPLKSWGVEAAMDEFWAAAKAARNHEVAQHQEFLNRPRCRFVPVCKHASQLYSPAFEPNPTPPRPPRAKRFQKAVDDTPIPICFFPKPKELVGCLKKKCSRPRVEGVAVAFVLGDVDRRKTVERWIGIEQGVESREQLVCDITGLQFVGKSLHVHPKPCRIMGTNLVGWATTGPDKADPYSYLFGRGLREHAHTGCKNPSCNRPPNRISRPCI